MSLKTLPYQNLDMHSSLSLSKLLSLQQQQQHLWRVLECQKSNISPFKLVATGGLVVGGRGFSVVVLEISLHSSVNR